MTDDRILARLAYHETRPWAPTTRKAKVLRIMASHTHMSLGMVEPGFGAVCVPVVLAGVRLPNARSKSLVEKTLSKMIRAELRRLVENRVVHVNTLANQDKYGRFVARISVSEIGDLSLYLLDKGVVVEETTNNPEWDSILKQVFAKR